MPATGTADPAFATRLRTRKRRRWRKPRHPWRAAGVAVSVVSAGSTPTAIRSARGAVTEERPGTYIFGDAIQVGLGSMASASVALTVVATVVSTAVDGQFVVDAGAKVLSKDTAAYLDGHGVILGWPEARLVRLNDYHGIAEVPAGSARPAVGEVVSIMPNHVCPVVNLVDELVMVRGGHVADAGPWTREAATADAGAEAGGPDVVAAGRQAESVSRRSRAGSWRCRARQRSEPAGSRQDAGSSRARWCNPRPSMPVRRGPGRRPR